MGDVTPIPPQRIRVAVSQHEPEWLDLQKSVEKTCMLIAEAAQEGAELITFPELFIPGYPCWIWSRPVDFDLSTKYAKNSLRIDSSEMSKICAVAAKNKITVSLGFSENDGGHSLYIAQCTIGADGEMKMRRRKLKPTHMERTMFGDASGASLNNVVDTPVGKVGSLACWEHLQPLLKYNTYLQREEIHNAAWPPLYPFTEGPGLWSMSADGCRSLSRTYAAESQSFTLHTSAVLSAKGIKMMDLSTSPLFGSPGGGCSAIYGPDGRQLSKDMPPTEEGLIITELDMDEIVRIRGFADPCGHYSRPDMLWLGVDWREKSLRVDGNAE